MDDSYFENLYYGYLCQLKKEEYMLRSYVINHRIIQKKEDGKYYDVLTNKSYDILTMDEKGHFNIKEEGTYFTLLTPYSEHLKNKERLNMVRSRKWKMKY